MVAQSPLGVMVVLIRVFSAGTFPGSAPVWGVPGAASSRRGAGRRGRSARGGRLAEPLGRRAIAVSGTGSP